MNQPSIRHHIVFTVSLITLIGLLLLALYVLADVWLLSFGGVLLAVGLQGLSGGLSRWTPMPQSLSTAVICLGFCLLSGLTLWSMGPAFIDGLTQIREALPGALASARSYVSSHAELTQLIETASESLPDLEPGPSILGKFGDLFSSALGAVSTLGNALIFLFVITVVALYTALSPTTYLSAFLSVLPSQYHNRTRDVLSQLASSLRWWLAGRLASMAVVGILTWLGLLLLGVPSAGTLGALSAILSFIPNIGPILSAIPAILLGLSQEPTVALYVFGLYVLVQTVESYIVTPLIQQRVVSLPPAIVIVVQLALGTALGLLGLLFATPLAVCVMVLIRTLWIEDRLGAQPIPAQS